MNEVERDIEKLEGGIRKENEEKWKKAEEADRKRRTRVDNICCTIMIASVFIVPALLGSAVTLAILSKAKEAWVMLGIVIMSIVGNVINSLVLRNNGTLIYD